MSSVLGSSTSLAPGAQVRRESLRRAANWLALLLGLVLASALAGWLISRGHVKYLAVLGVLVGLAVLAVRAPGPLAALLLLAVLNGIPFIDLSGRLPGGAHIQDAAVLALMALLFAYRGPVDDPRLARIARAATIWGACFAGYWLITLVRSWLLDGIPLLKAALFGRDFLYFALLLPLAVHASMPRSSLRIGLRIAAAGLILYGIGATVSSVSSVSSGGLAWLVHPQQLAPQDGLTRVYALMGDPANAGFVFAAAYLAVEKSGRRWRVAVLTVSLGLAAVLQLTRATYFALAAGFLAATAVWSWRYVSATRLLIRAVMAALLVGALALAVLSTEAATGSTPVSGVIVRAESGITQISQSSGNVGYRESVDRQMLHVLKADWPIGLGFLHPAAHYESGVPSGTIRNADTGVMNALMTMGLLGALFIYAPLVYAFAALLRLAGSRRREVPAPRWLVLGGCAWLVFAVTGSATLILLFSVGGLTLTAVILALLSRTALTGRPALRPQGSVS